MARTRSAADEAGAGQPTRRQPVLEPTMRPATEQSEAGPSTWSQFEQPPEITYELEDEPEIMLSPLPSMGEEFSIEELERRVMKYAELTKEYPKKRKEKDKDKGKGKHNGKRNVRNFDGVQTRRKVSYLHEKILHTMLLIMKKFNGRGFVYEMVPEVGKPLTGASDSLRSWWREDIRFDIVGPTEIDKFKAENLVSMSYVPRNREPQSTFEMLMHLSDPTLGSCVSDLMQQCHPPQRKHPFEMGSPPPWWPKTTNDWWHQTGIPKEEGPPPYRKPHDLNKKWKVAVLLGIIKHIAPNFVKLNAVSQENRSLKRRITAKELKYWKLALKEEAKLFCTPENPVERLFPFLCSQGGNFPNQNVAISGGMATEPGTVAREQIEMTEDESPVFTCDDPRCPYHDPRYGFISPEQCDLHRLSCLFSLQRAQIHAPVRVLQEPPSFSAPVATSEIRAPAEVVNQPPSNTPSFQNSEWPITFPLIGETQTAVHMVTSGVQHQPPSTQFPTWSSMMSSLDHSNDQMASSGMVPPSWFMHQQPSSPITMPLWEQLLESSAPYSSSPLVTTEMFAQSGFAQAAQQPFMNQFEQGLEMDGCYSQPQMATGEMLAQQAPELTYDAQQNFAPNILSEVQGSGPIINWNYYYGDLGTSTSGLQDPQATPHQQQIVAPPTAVSTSGTQILQYQGDGGNVDGTNDGRFWYLDPFWSSWFS